MPEQDFAEIYTRLRAVELELEGLSVKMAGLLWAVAALATSAIGLGVTLAVRIFS